VGRQEGQLEHLDVHLRGTVLGSHPDEFALVPANERTPLVEGMSGGAVTVQDQLIGFLLRAEQAPGSRDVGVWWALRADRAALLILRALEGSPGSSDMVGSCRLERVSPALPSQSDQPFMNRASLACGAQVVAWSAAALTPESRPENLVGAGGAGARWRASGVEEVRVKVHLCPGTGGVVTRVRYETVGCLPTDNRELAVEVSVNSVTLGYSQDAGQPVVEVGSDSPLIAGDLTLRFTGNTHEYGAHTVCVGPLTVN
jgi:hypothetical protein